eukprot:TRINITY_DN31224_c0_g1_i1.p1 TRINITY_DN31224_c0_g1~~TRINITY_DN31224_c0_g1_i1.p1  ORF type:complete len:358 (+),score=85.31 TRINITY_DN31224_c0_g1_i1:89-1075(+)
MSAVGRSQGGCGWGAAVHSARDTDAGAEACNTPRHKGRASPPSPRRPVFRRAPFVGVRGGGAVPSRTPTPPPTEQQDGSSGEDKDTEVQRLRAALAAAEEQNAALSARCAALSAALAAARSQSARDVNDHIEQLGALQQLCAASWAELEDDDWEEPRSQPLRSPRWSPRRSTRGRGCSAGRPSHCLPLTDDDSDFLSPRSLGAAVLPWSPRTQGAEVTLPSTPRSYRGASSPRSLAAATPLPPPVRFQGAAEPGGARGALCSPRLGGASSTSAASEAGSSRSLGTALGSPPGSPRLGAAAAAPGVGVGAAAAAAIRWLGALLHPLRAA